MDKSYRICGSEVIERTFVKRHFKSNSQDNIDCHLTFMDGGHEDELLLEQAKEEMDRYIAGVFEQ